MKLLFENWRQYLAEITLRVQKDKVILYHIGPTPAKPEPTAPETYVWGRSHRAPMPDTGVFMSPKYLNIRRFHGVRGNVYAYKVPHWVIKKEKGIHRFDSGTEIYISGETWEEAGNEIEFLDNDRYPMSAEALEAEAKAYGEGLPSNRRGSTKKPGHMTDEEWERWKDKQLKKKHLDGLRSTSRLEDVIKMLTPNERKEAIDIFSNIQYGTYGGTKSAKKRDAHILSVLKEYE